LAGAVASSGKYLVRSAAIRFRRRLRESEAAFIVLALLAGLAAGILTNAQQFLAHGIQHFFYGVTINRLSALGSIHHLAPAGAADRRVVAVFMARWLHRRRRTLIDVVEANALHGGRLPLSDSLIIAGQTIVSNGAGASVGLEAAYAQMGGGIASALGQWFRCAARICAR
jgi:CIC family chloride channel protein